jgi:hypothetical protein
MTIIRLDEMDRLIDEGKACEITQASIATSAGTAPIAATGNLGGIFFPEAVGSTLWSTIVKPRIPSGNFRFHSAHLGSTRGLTYMIARLHKMGTINLAATGACFTADAGVFPVLRTEMGQASKPQILTPMILVTTATTVTAPILKMNYDNQDGTSRTGTIQTTFPAAATALGTMLMPRLEVGDSGIQKINGIQVDTAASAGAANMYGLEPLDLISIFAANVPASASCRRGYNPAPLEEPVPTSGTLDSYIGIIALGSVAATTIRAIIRGAKNG